MGEHALRKLSIEPVDLTGGSFAVPARGARAMGVEPADATSRTGDAPQQIVVLGDEDSETILGSADADSLFGYGGDDLILAYGGDDVVHGGDGHDELYGHAGGDLIHGEAGDDLIYGGDDNDAVYGGDGADIIHGGDPGEDPYSAYDGDDLLLGQAGNDTLHGGNGADWLEGGAGDDYVVGGHGVDTVNFEDAAAAVVVTLDSAALYADTGSFQQDTGEGLDVILEVENLRGSDYGDTLYGDDGANTIEGLKGDDYINGDLGDDYLFGGEGDDEIVDTEGQGRLYGDDGADIITAGGSADHLDGGDGADVLDGGEGADEIQGGEGDDVLVGGGGDDVIFGGLGSDTLSFESLGGPVTVSLAETGPQATGFGDVTVSEVENLHGSDFDDGLTGDAEANTIQGLGGADTIRGGGGDDLLDGGAGSDTFAFAAGDGSDVINGFAVGPGGDSIQVTGFTTYTLSQEGAHLRIVLDEDNSILLTNVDAANFTADNINIPLYDPEVDPATTVVGFLDAVDPASTAGADRNADLVLLQTGGYAAVWQTDVGDGSGQCVRMRLFDVLGAPAGPDFVVNTTASGDQTLPEVTVLSDGRILVVWVSDAGDGAGSCVMGRIFEEDGSPSGGEFLVNSTVAGDQTSPEVAALDDGGFLVTWSSADGGDGSGGCIRARAFDDQASPTGADFIVNTATAGGQSGVEALTLSDGRVLLAWNDGQARFFDAAGDPLGAAFAFAPSSPPNQARSIAELNDGRIVIAYESGSLPDQYVYVQVLDASGAPDGAAIPVQAEAGMFGAVPQVVALASGGFAVFWGGGSTLDAGTSHSLTMRVFDADGDPVTGDILVAYNAAGGVGAPSAVLLPNGDIVVSYDTGPGGGLESRVISVADGDTGSDDTDDVIQGIDVNETLSGLAGDDILLGAAGEDTLEGGAGEDTLTGGDGADVIRFGAGGGHDTVTDFVPGADRIEVTGFASCYLREEGDHLRIVFDENNSILLENVDFESFTAGDIDIPIVPVTNEIGGTSAGETLTGTAGMDLIEGLGGADVLEGLGNDDELLGGDDDDLLRGGTGDDVLDGGAGVDTADFSTALAGVVASLADGSASGDGNDTLEGVENLTGSAFGDSLTGDGGANRLVGLAGDDNLSGGEGDDTLSGGEGADTLAGGGGTDTVDYADAGLGVSVNLGVATPQNTGGAGADTLSSIENAVGSAFGDTLRGSSAANVLSGGGGADTLLGEGADDTLNGGSGNDSLNGGSGADTTNGGLGNDQHYVDNAGDVVNEAAGEGADRVFASVSYVLAEGTEIETLSTHSDNSTTAINLTGNSLANTVVGNNGANTLAGGGGADSLLGNGGDDFLIGGLGADSLNGGGGNDTFVFAAGDGHDVVTGFVAGGTDDAIQVTGYATYTLAQEGANLRIILDADNSILLMNVSEASFTAADINIPIAGPTIINGTASGETLTGGAWIDHIDGLGGNDTLLGQGAADLLTGGQGDDVLNGGAGVDETRGGAGADSHWLDNAGDVVVEAAGEGTDRVFASVSYVLAAGVAAEILSTTSDNGTAAIDLTGNELANTLIGNNGANTLRGEGGADSLLGGGGADNLVGGAGDDALNGGLGADHSNGGLGNDSHYVDNAGDTVAEAAGEGADRIFAAVSYTLGAGVEVETLSTTSDTGVAAIDLTGNELNNKLVGNNGANTLDGGLGTDTLVGGGGADSLIGGSGNDSLDGGSGADTTTGGVGNDSHYVDNAGDVVVEATGEGTDRVFASVSYTLSEGAAVETLSTNSDSGTSAIDLTGNGLANTLVGNNGANVLSGGGGADSLLGNGGDDILVGGGGSDQMRGGAGADQFLYTAGLSGADTILDFADGSDTIRFQGVAGLDDFSDLTLSTNGAGWAVITLPDGSTITLTGITQGQVDASDFSWG